MNHSFLFSLNLWYLMYQNLLNQLICIFSSFLAILLISSSSARIRQLFMQPWSHNIHLVTIKLCLSFQMLCTLYPLSCFLSSFTGFLKISLLCYFFHTLRPSNFSRNRMKTRPHCSIPDQEGLFMYFQPFHI